MLIKKLLMRFGKSANVDTPVEEDERFTLKTEDVNISVDNVEKRQFSLQSFLSLSSQILAAKGDEEKLRLCRLAFPDFPAFVSSCMEQDGELPPVVPVRDTMPELLMRFGQWDEAESVVRACISCGAYGHTEFRNSRDHKGHWVPESGGGNLEMIALRRSAADAAIAYIVKNPGILQSKIYKVPELSEVDHDALVWFCRSYRRIRKEKQGKSNLLFIDGGGGL